MISYEEALTIIFANTEALPKTRQRLEKLLDSVLAEPVVAAMDLPSFDNSAVDGFGVRVADVEKAASGSPVKLSVKGVIRAGDEGQLRVREGTACKILTGAPVPPGVEAVVMKEFCQELNGHVLVAQKARQGDNIRRRGGEFLRGEAVLPSGLRITPPVVGLLANLGYSTFAVHRKPRVAVVTTGNELVKPGRRLLPGKIFDSNSYALKAAVAALGIDDCLTFHAAEDESRTREVLARALASADVVISAGGVSVGDYDFVKGALEQLGVRTLLWKIAIKPGKPVYFGTLVDKLRRRRKCVFGLPGNPVSALVTFNQFVKPALAKMMGISAPGAGSVFMVTLKKTIRKKVGRTEFVRGVLKTENERLVVEATAGQDSHMLGGLSLANVLIHFPSDIEQLSQGEPVLVEFLGWNNF